jgi:hypothetical protein
MKNIPANLKTPSGIGFILTARPVRFIFGAALLILIALAWSGIVADQMPCFLGVPNCD